MLAHIAGLPVEEMLPFVYGASGVGIVAHVATRWRKVSRRRSDRRVRRNTTGGE